MHHTIRSPVAGMVAALVAVTLLAGPASALDYGWPVELQISGGCH